MKLNHRLALLMVLLTLLPALPSAWVMRQIVGQSIDLGLNPQVDGALEAGVRQAREHFLLQRKLFRAELELAAADWLALPDQAALRRRAADWSEPMLAPADRVFLQAPTGEEIPLQIGKLKVDGAPPRAEDPPLNVTAAVELAAGWRLLARRPLTEDWRRDAGTLAATLQVIRGLQMRRNELERGFWLPILSIYAVTLILGLLLATHLGRGITGPVLALHRATEDVSAGRWDTQLPLRGSGEVTQLTERFNDMVRTLDAQRRNLVDLEKMAGWREMARALAHEVKNPLTPIQLTVEEMRVRYRGEDEEYRGLLDECTRIVVEEVESLRQVVTRFREFSRPVPTRMAPVAINRLIADLAALQKDMRVELDLDPELDEIEADADTLRQMLFNLARNASSATAELPDPRLRLTSRAGEESVTITVEDNGPGIPIVERQRIFEPYRSGRAGGLGLGLALVKGIVLAHGGRIGVENSTLGGASLCFELPLRQLVGGLESIPPPPDEGKEGAHE